MRGDLHYNGPNPLLHHPGEEPLQVEGLRRRMQDRFHGIANTVLYRTNQACLMACQPADPFDQVCGRSLAVGARYTNERDLP